MTIADDILQEVENDAEENTGYTKEPSRPVTKQEPREQEEHIEKEKPQPPKEPEEKLELKENEIDNKKTISMKQVAILVSTVSISYVVIIQYKLADPLLNMYLPDTSIITKRIILFLLVVIFAYIIPNNFLDL